MEDQIQNQFNKKQSFKDIFWQLMLVVVIGTIFVVLASLIVKVITPKEIEKDKVEDIVEDIIKEKKIIISRPKCEKSFNNYQKLLNKKQFIKIVENKKSYAENRQFVSNIQPLISRTGAGSVSCGYLYVKVSKNNKPLHKEWDSIYINPHDFGGHLLREKSILHENRENYTEILFSLDSISYSGFPYNSNAQNFRIADWVKLLNVNNHVKFNIGLSVENQDGLINEIIIAYKCWNPETGEETQTCQLGLEKNKSGDKNMKVE